jgi:hypothetical protein
MTEPTIMIVLTAPPAAPQVTIAIAGPGFVPRATSQRQEARPPRAVRVPRPRCFAPLSYWTLSEQRAPAGETLTDAAM